ncbi:hypothetical protein AB0K43_14535 [Kitasatospora sp. NPDC049258]|uniref:hypothetical protein n=1 Tax=Kitasatospora sp. NPDC049258 TaxID=3155394 RepID=UPI003422CF71
MTGASAAAARPGEPLPAVPVLGEFLVTAGIVGVMRPKPFGGVPGAVQALVGALRPLPLSAEHRYYLEGRLVGRGALELITHRLQRAGRFELTFRVVHRDAGAAELVEHVLTITAGKSGARR